MITNLNNFKYLFITISFFIFPKNKADDYEGLAAHGNIHLKQTKVRLQQQFI